MSEILKNPTKKALSELRLIAGSVRGLLALEEQLSEYGDLEQAIAARKATLDGLRTEEARLAPKVEELSAAIQRMRERVGV